LRKCSHFSFIGEAVPKLQFWNDFPKSKITGWACTGGMKSLFLYVLPALLALGCGRNPADSGYIPELPDLPPAWEQLLGKPSWRIEWIGPGGRKESLVTREAPEIRVPPGWTSPVSAWPFWPEKGIAPGIFRPAGALFPFDADGDLLRLSWRGGVEAFLYGELAAAHSAGAEASVPRHPWNFNWPKFRELWDDPDFPEDIRLDPWKADWKHAALHIAAAGFNKRRLVPQERTALPVPAFPGPWISVSPFAPPLIFGEGETPVFPAGPEAESWFSPAGVLRCNAEAWIFIPWEAAP
jgi:hypothetical protein